MDVSIIGKQYMFLEGMRGLLSTEGYSSKIYLFDRKGVDEIIWDGPEFIIFDMDGVSKKSELADIRLQLPNTRFLCVLNQASEDVVRMCGSLKIEGVLLKESPSPDLVRAIERVRKGEIYFHELMTHHLGSVYYKLCESIAPKESPVKEEIKKENKGEENIIIRGILTKREYACLFYLCCGYSNRELATSLFISEKTVKNHISKILHKMEVNDRTSAVLKALHEKYITLDEIGRYKESDTASVIKQAVEKE